MKPHLIYSLVLACILHAFSVNGQEHISAFSTGKDLQAVIRLKHKIIPLSNPVYQLLDYLETNGSITFLPMAKPYTKGYIAKALLDVMKGGTLSDREEKTVQAYLSDVLLDVPGLQLRKSDLEESCLVAGFSASTIGRTGTGDHGTWGTNLIAEPFFAGDLGSHISFTAGMGLGFERLSPDLFFQSSTKDGRVHFPHQAIGYSYLPYQFNYNTMWTHVSVPGFTEGVPVREELTAAMIYHMELNGSWFNNALQINVHNQRRSIGYSQNNMVLSSSARRFPAIEMKVQPAPWIRYSYVMGSLFSYASQEDGFGEDIYGYDLGQTQNNFTNHLLELMPWKWLHLATGGGNIWSKRMEIAYMVPFVMPHLTQIDVGDHDNLTLFFDAAVKVKRLGKVWGEFFMDEFSWDGSGKLFKRPRNRYGVQLGWQSNILSALLPGTTSRLQYTRLTPFVYTHYPETDFNPFGGDRPLNMSYTHDGMNLGFYLPPNSAEWQWKLVNIAIPDLVLKLDNKLIRHGTNDLSSENIQQIYGDINRHQIDHGSDYPQLEFGKDGIYDRTWITELSFDWKLRNIRLLQYYRLVGSLGYANTKWQSNVSGIVEPNPVSLMTASLGIVVEL